MIGEWLEDIIHHPHESYWSICQLERHDQPLEKAFLIFDGSLPNIGMLNGHLMIARLQINISEVLCTLELVDKVVDPGNGILISDCDFV